MSNIKKTLKRIASSEAYQALVTAIEHAFPLEALCSELRRVFRSSDEFFSSRGALVELRGKLGYTGSASDEAVIKPYLRHVAARAFGDR